MGYINKKQINHSADITVVYQETETNLLIEDHFHNSDELIYILEGKVEIKINTQKYVAMPGSLIFISQLESHELEILQYPYQRFYLLIKPQLFQNIITDPRLSSIFKHRPENFNHVLVLNENKRDIVTSLFTELKAELDNDLLFNMTSASALLQLLFIHLYRNYTSSFPLTDITKSMNTIHQIQKYVDEHCIESVTLKEVSEMFFIDMCYLSRLFKKTCGFSFKEYLILKKLSKAKDLLTIEDMSITKVCTNSGFGNVNHFIRIFKKNEGISPYQYKKKYQK